jgi:hypothetical protein
VSRDGPTIRGVATHPTRRLVEQRVRNRIIEHLELTASAEAQRKYQLDVPWVSVPVEIINGWEDSVSPESRPSLSGPVYSHDELSAIDSFQLVWEAASADLPPQLPPLEEWMAEPEWANLQRAAARALAVFMVRGRFPEDEEAAV